MEDLRTAYAQALVVRRDALTLALQAASVRAEAQERLAGLRARNAALQRHSREAARLSRELLNGRLRVVVADRDPDMTTFLRFLLEDVDRRFQVLATARDGAEAVGAVVALQPDLVVLDDELAVVSLVEAVRDIRAFAPRTVVALHAMPGVEGLAPGCAVDLLLDRTGRALEIPQSLLTACGRG